MEAPEWKTNSNVKIDDDQDNASGNLPWQAKPKPEASLSPNQDTSLPQDYILGTQNQCLNHKIKTMHTLAGETSKLKNDTDLNFMLNFQCHIKLQVHAQVIASDWGVPVPLRVSCTDTQAGRAG